MESQIFQFEVIERSATLYITGQVTRSIADMMLRKCQALPEGVRFLSINVSEMRQTSAAQAMVDRLLAYWGAERGGGRVRVAFSWSDASRTGNGNAASVTWSVRRHDERFTVGERSAS